jgi:hypothetical protein
VVRPRERARRRAPARGDAGRHGRSHAVAEARPAAGALCAQPPRAPTAHHCHRDAGAGRRPLRLAPYSWGMAPADEERQARAEARRDTVLLGLLPALEESLRELRPRLAELRAQAGAGRQRARGIHSPERGARRVRANPRPRPRDPHGPEPGRAAAHAPLRPAAPAAPRGRARTVGRSAARPVGDE